MTRACGRLRRCSPIMLADDLKAVLHPVPQLVQQDLLLVRHNREPTIQGKAVDRGRQQIGEALQKVDIVPAEAPPVLAVDLKHAHRVVLATDDHIDRALDAVPAQHIRAAETRVGQQILQFHGFSGQQRVAGG